MCGSFDPADPIIRDQVIGRNVPYDFTKCRLVCSPKDDGPI